MADSKVIICPHCKRPRQSDDTTIENVCAGCTKWFTAVESARVVAGIETERKQRTFICAGIGVLLILIAGITYLATRPNVDGAVKDHEWKLQIVGEKYVKKMLKDPGVAQFRHQFIGSGGAPCGEVNAKNSFGAYTGFTRYVVAGPDLAMIEGSNVKPEDFDGMWSQLCRK